MNSTSRKMRNNIVASLIAVVTVVVLLLSMNIITQAIANKPNVQSPDTYGGKYAYGHTGYSTSIASAYTRHEIVGYKEVRVKGIYRIGDSIGRTALTTGYSTTSGDAYMSVSLPAGADHFMGSYAEHKIVYLSSSWSDYTAIGEQ